MPDMSWEHAPEARAALNAIVTDPEHGVAALSNAQTMSNLLKDYLPDAPREKSILVAAAEAGLADTLREHVSQGMDPNTAIRLTASSFSSSTPFTPEACSWVTDEIAVALGISEPRSGGDQPGGSPLGGTPAGFAPVGNEGRPTQIAPSPGAPSPGAPSPGAPSPGAPSPGAPGQPVGQGGAGYPQAPAQGFASPAQPNSQEQPTAQGYRPGYAPQPGAAGQVPVQGFPGQQAQGFQGQGFQGQGYPGQQAQPYPAQQPQPYQGQPSPGYPGQVGRPGYPGQPAFPQTGQPGAPGGWQPGVYGPGPGFGGPQKPSGSRRGLLVGGGIVLLVIIIIVAVIALTHKPNKSAHGGSGSPSTSASTPSTTPTGSPTAGGVESLRTIMNPAGLTPVGTECTQAFLFGLKASTLTSRTFCAKTTYKSIDVWGYQFDSHADYQAGVTHINSYTGFHKTSSDCPPAAGSDAGSTGWHANSNPKYSSRPGQFIECFVDNNRPLLIWTMPTMNVFFIAQDRGKGDTVPRIVDWWKTVNYG